jgi:DNA-binding HxlR family transcriptional regulator
MGNRMGPTTQARMALARTLEIVGERWTLLVLRDCLFGVRRFTDWRDRLDIPRAVLATRLAGLVEAGLLERREYRPGRGLGGTNTW